MLKFNLIESVYHISLDVTVRKVREDNLRDFIFLPYRIYAKDENWLPPLYKTRLNYLNVLKTPFIQNSGHMAYMAYRHNLPVGCLVCGVLPKHFSDKRAAFLASLKLRIMKARGRCLKRRKRLRGKDARKF